MLSYEAGNRRRLNLAALASCLPRRIALVLGFAIAATLASSVQAQPPKADIPKSTDHPLVSRIPGSVITDYAQVDFDDFLVPLGKLGSDGVPAKSETVEGKITRIVYATPAPRSLLEVFKNFQDGLTAGGFKILFSCTNEGCISSGKGPTELASVGNEDWTWSKGQRFLAARRSGPTGDVTVTVHVGQWAALDHGTQTVLFITEAKPMDAGLVKVDAKALSSDLASQGHVAVYGIYFDTAKAVVKPESDTQLQQVAQLLKSQPALQLLVVGHTDNVGGLTPNMQLSRARAEAVVQALVSRYGVAPTRLSAQGAGPLAPLASNLSEDGRARNRRVELVEQ